MAEELLTNEPAYMLLPGLVPGYTDFYFRGPGFSDVERAVREGRMSVAEGQALKRFYEQELDGYAYLEP